MNKTRGSQSPICQFLVFTEVTTFFFFVSSLAAEEAARERPQPERFTCCWNKMTVCFKIKVLVLIYHVK